MLFVSSSLAVLDRLLAALGRRGSRALAIAVPLAIATPPLGRVLQPWLTEAVFCLLVLSFLRLDVPRLRAHLRRPRLLLAATLWTALGVPLLLAAAARAVDLPARAPELNLGLMLQALASPLMAGPSLAALMGLDATLVLVTLVLGTLALPLVAAVLGPLLLGPALSPGGLAGAALLVRLTLLLGGSLLAALALRRAIGLPRLARHDAAVDGASILALAVFVFAVMGPVAAAAWAAPLVFAGLAALAFATFAALFLLTAWLFRRAGQAEALSLGIMASQRNMGLMVAAVGGILPPTAWLYFALCQFPIYLSPLLLRPFVRPPRVRR